MEEKIISSANHRIKDILKLKKKSSVRKNQDLIIAEGLREISMACQNGFRLKTLLVCAAINGRQNKKLLSSSSHIISISKEVFQKIAYRENTDGLIAVLIPKHYHLSTLKLSSLPLLLILESVEKPGNLGAVLRTADGCGADAVIVCDPLTDIYNPNVIRSSMGSVFSKQIVTASSEEVIRWLKEKKIKLFAAMVDAQKKYSEADFRSSCAVVLGSEANGLSEKWQLSADEKISIPMLGKADSLNVSVSAAVILYEALRQRTIWK